MMSGIKYILLLLLFLCCRKEEVRNIGTEGKKELARNEKYLWKMDLKGQVVLQGDLQVAGEEEGLVYNDKIIFSDYRNGKKNLWGIDAYSGDTVYRVEYDYSFFYLDEGHIYKNYFLSENVGDQYICIDLENGKEVWNKKYDGDYKYMDAMDDKMFIVDYGEDIDILMAIDVETGKLEEVLSPEVPKDTEKPSAHDWRIEISKLEAYKSKGGDIMLLMEFEHQPDFVGNKWYSSYKGVYNYTKKKYVINHNKEIEFDMVYKEKAYYIIDGDNYWELYCYDLNTGKEEWKYGGFDISLGWRVLKGAKDKLIIRGRKKGSDRIYGFDIRERVIKWKIEEGILVNYIKYSDGKLYTSWGPPNIIDIETGEVLWKDIRSPLDKGGCKAFIGGFWVVPPKEGKKGRIAFSCVRRIYCYEDDL